MKNIKYFCTFEMHDYKAISPQQNCFRQLDKIDHR